MILIKVAPQDVQGRLLAQNMITYECIVEVETALSCEHTVVEDIPHGFMQLLYPGSFGEYLDIRAIKRLDALKEGLPEEQIAKATTQLELELIKQNKDLTDDVDTLALTVLEIQGVV